jgi:hypothetical protein
MTGGDDEAKLALLSVTPRLPLLMLDAVPEATGVMARIIVLVTILADANVPERSVKVVLLYVTLVPLLV